MLDILIYEREDGRPPFVDRFDALDRRAAAKVTVAVERIRPGNLSSLKGIGGGVQEFRIDWGPGCRLYLGRGSERLVILLTGGTKRRQSADIERAQALWADYKRRR